MGRTTCRRFCFTPSHEVLRRKGPLRDLVHLACGWIEGSCDLREIDTQAEIAAFVRECRPALDQIEERVGKPPTLRWGLVTWSES